MRLLQLWASSPWDLWYQHHPEGLDLDEDEHFEEVDLSDLGRSTEEEREAEQEETAKNINNLLVI